jgi:hypothetical protein
VPFCSTHQTYVSVYEQNRELIAPSLHTVKENGTINMSRVQQCCKRKAGSRQSTKGRNFKSRALSHNSLIVTIREPFSLATLDAILFSIDWLLIPQALVGEKVVWVG